MNDDTANGYIGVNIAMNWCDAESYCESNYGTNLASVASSQDNTNVLTASSSAGFGSSNFWVGGSDFATEGTFVWSDGTPFSYTNWLAGEPNNNNGGEHCLEYSGYVWNDFECHYEMPFVCNYGTTGMIYHPFLSYIFEYQTTDSVSVLICTASNAVNERLGLLHSVHSTWH